MLFRSVATSDDVYVATSNQGKVYKFQSEPASTGSYESAVLDAGTIASWGRVSWRWSGNEAVELSTRVGNTAEPDNSWSAWSDSYKSSGDKIANQRARYLQWRAVLKSAGHLDHVRIAYLQQNLRPRVTEITQLPAGIELQAQPSLANSMGIVNVTTGGRSLIAPRERGRDMIQIDPRQALTPGVQSFTWKAEDENEDVLDYSVYFKGEDESDWKPLVKNFRDAFHTLNTAALPEGVYRLKVTVSDEPSNPPETALTGEKISEPFAISTATPQVKVIDSTAEGKRVTVRFITSISSGSIATAEYSVDGTQWWLVFPEDGIADSTTEEYRFMTPELASGEHLIGIRASDRGGSTGTASVIVRIQ